MAKTQSRPFVQRKFEEFAKRRAGARYMDAAIAAQERLQRLRIEYKDVPPSYRGYLAVGICSCLESHMKYGYAAAAERFSEHPDLLKSLFKDIQVDIDTLISTTSKTFHLADVVAASITVSTLSAYLTKASYLFSTLKGAPHNFPWDWVRVFTNGDPELDKDYQQKLDRLGRVFDARHKFVHETSVFGDSDQILPNDDPIECVDDALALISQFQKEFEQFEMSPKYAAIKDDEGMDDAVARLTNEIDEAFERLKADCDERQYESIEKFKIAFREYLYARCDFQASVFVAQRSEASMSYFIDLVPEYRDMLKSLGPTQRYMLAQYPLSKQYQDMGLEPDGTIGREP